MINTLLILAASKYKPIRGVAFHLCSCHAPCPCMTSKDGDMEGCQLAAVYHFTDGGYVNAKLKGLTIVVVARPKALADRDRKIKVKRPLEMAVYLPQGISEGQRRDLLFILVEHQMRFGGANMDARSVPIRFQKTARGYAVTIPGVLRARTNAMLDAKGKPRVVDGVPFEEGSRWTLGKTSEHWYADPKEKAWKWSYPANNGAWCLFGWARNPHGEPEK